jgi:ATP-dependent Zn protease
MDEHPPATGLTEVTAYHEAGHAVAALALGRPVQRVSIRANEEYLGTCHFGKGVFRPSEDWLEREMLIALAGIAAEGRHTGRFDWDAAGRDRAYAYQLAVQRAGNPRQAERLITRMLSKTEYLLGRDGNWRAVEMIAAALMRGEVISGRAARHLFEQSNRQ